MVDHCLSEKLLEHFLEFTEKINIDLKLMLHIGIDHHWFEHLLKPLPHIKIWPQPFFSLGLALYTLFVTHSQQGQMP